MTDGASSRRSRQSRQFEYIENPDDLHHEQLKFDNYEENIDDMENDEIIKYIENEAKNVQQERENDVSVPFEFWKADKQ